ncbi:MAG: FecR domain-containing protein [Polyangia bacterium]
MSQKSDRCEQSRRALEAALLGEMAEDEEESLEAAREHCRGCASCAAFAAALDALPELRDRPSAAEAERVAAAAIELVEARRRRAVIGALGAAAAVVLAMLAWAGGEDRARTRAGESPAIAKAPVPLEEIGIELARAEGSELSLRRARSGGVSIELASGAVALRVDPERSPRNAVEVATERGRVEVVGTIFGVSASRRDGVRVDVLRGAVRVVEKAGASRKVEAGLSYRFGRGRTETLSEDRARRVANLLGIDPPTAARPDAEREAAQEEVGDAAIADAAVEQKKVPNRERRAERAPTADELLREARELRGQRDWAGAARSYRRLIELFPGGSQAEVAAINLAHLRLRHLGRPAGALHGYRGYLTRRPRGPLAEEARRGVASSYRALGETELERRALRQILTVHPGTPAASWARARLEELGDDQRKGEQR